MLFATTKNCTEPKVWESAPKKTTVEMYVAKKSVEKMQARGKTCFLQHAKDTRHLKVEKGDSKIEL